MVVSCVAPDCKETFRRNGPTFHRFPTRKDHLQEWLSAMKLEGFKPNKNSFVCANHFRTQDYTLGQERKRLKASAVPCLFNTSRPHREKTVLGTKNRAETPKRGRKNKKKLSFCIASIALDHSYSIGSFIGENMGDTESWLTKETAQRKILKAKKTLSKETKISSDSVIDDCDYLCMSSEGPEMLNPWQSRVIEACFLIPVICDLEVRDDPYEESGEEILS